ncbi:Hypothetical_protein [Hexamita inflata]|uniref:Hypothetical_protein n=1 Tax=Hexamita inflata TaxID=28002 RepID=A0AA86PML6_9EUKA|nr:Hypothetical protein HINF_LOCUS29931 [Hexamita inflata]
MNQDEMIKKVIKEEYEHAQMKVKKQSKQNAVQPEPDKDSAEVLNKMMEKMKQAKVKKESFSQAKEIQVQKIVLEEESEEKPDMKKLRAKAKKINKAYEDLPSEDLLDFDFSTSESDNTKKKIADLKAKTKRKSPAELIEIHTQLYKEALTFCPDLSNATPKDLCEIIDNLKPGTPESSCFWFGLVRKNLPEKPVSHYRSYYKTSYRRIAYQEKLNDEDKKLLLELLEKHKDTHSLNQMTQEAVSTMFVGRDIFPQDIQNYIGKHLNIYNKEKFGYTTRKQDPSFKIFMLEQKAKEEEEAHYHNLYKQGLKQFDMNIRSPMDVCYQIKKLTTEQTNTFWDFIVQNDKNGMNREDQINYYSKYQEKVCPQTQRSSFIQQMIDLNKQRE